MHRIITVAAALALGFAVQAQAQGVTEKIGKAAEAESKARDQARDKKRAEDDARSKANKEARDKNQGKLKAKMKANAEDRERVRKEHEKDPAPRR